MHDHEFWHSKWAANNIGFHLNEENPYLVNYWSALQPKREEKVLVPLCGKSLDLTWLAMKHDSVTGVELSDIAVKAFFAEQLYTPTVASLSSHHQLYQFDEISIYSGDYFDAPLETFDLIYDRAALVALSSDLQCRYADRTISLLKPNGRMLLMTIDYDQTEKMGPPFAINKERVEQLFSGCKVTPLYNDNAEPNHLQIKKGLSRFCEQGWLIEKN